MLIFGNFNPIVLVYTIGITFCLSTNYNTFFETTSLPDFTIRTLVDTFFINSFYFLWTNLWYLSAYFLILNMCLVLQKNRLTPLIVVYLWIPIILVIFITFMEWANNLFFLIEFFTPACKENTLLLNAVNRIHPLLLHSSFFLFFIIIPKRPNSIYQSTNLLNSLMLANLKKSIFIIILTLYLGSWWALQEGSWGGWWNWDPSEIFGLYILYRILSLYHFKENVTYSVHCNYYITMSIIYLYVFYCTMQINFSLVSHNFGFRSLKSFNPELFFFTSIIFIYYWVYLKSSSLVSKWLIFKILPRYYILLNHVLFIILTAVFCVVSLILINNFLWNTVHLKLYLVKFNYKYYINFLIVVLTTYFYHSNMQLILLGVVYIKSTFYILILFLQKFRGKLSFFLIHFSLIFVLVLSYFSCYSNVDMWNTFFSNKSNEDCFNYAINSIKLDLEFNYFKNFTAYEGKSFYLTFYRSLMWQTYFPGGVLEYYTTSLIDFCTPSLNSYIFIFIVLIMSSLKKHIRF